MTKKTKTIKGKGNYLPRRRRVAPQPQPQPQPQPEPEPEFNLEDDIEDEGFEENERYEDLITRRNLARDYLDRVGTPWLDERRRRGLPTREIPVEEIPDGILINLTNERILNDRIARHPLPRWVRGEIIPLVAEYPIYEDRNGPIQVDNTERMVVPFADQVIVSNLSDLGSLSGSSNSSRSSNPSFNSQSVNYSVPSDDSYFSLNFEDVSNQPSDLSNYSSDRSNRSSISSLSSQGEGINKKRILLSHNEIPQLRSNSFQKPFYFGGNQVPPHMRGAGGKWSKRNRVIPIDASTERELERREVNVPLPYNEFENLNFEEVANQPRSRNSSLSSHSSHLDLGDIMLEPERNLNFRNKGYISKEEQAKNHLRAYGKTLEDKKKIEEDKKKNRMAPLKRIGSRDIIYEDNISELGDTPRSMRSFYANPDRPAYFKTQPLGEGKDEIEKRVEIVKEYPYFEEIRRPPHNTPVGTIYNSIYSTGYESPPFDLGEAYVPQEWNKGFQPPVEKVGFSYYGSSSSY